MHERREHLPSPVKQHILWASPLKGMEQPVRSFKSFIRTVPPHPNPEDEKPLPPTPLTPEGPTFTSSSCPVVPAPLERSSSATSWKAPAEWEWDVPSPPSQPFRSTSIFPARKYAPLIPEPSPEMHIDSSSRSLEPRPLQQPQLLPIQETPNDRPEPPPRNPFRSSPSQLPSTEIGYGITMSPMDYSPPSLLPGSGTYESYPEALQLQTRLPQSSDLTYRVSDASTKAKAFASLGIGSPRDTKTGLDDWTTNPSSKQVEGNAPAHLTLRGKKLRSLDRGRPMVNDGLENSELTDQFQQLNLSQEYHNVLANQYHEQHIQQPKMPNQDQKLASHPSLWKKGSNGLSLFSSSPNLRTHGLHKRMASWGPLHPLNDGRKRHNANEVHQRSRSDSAVPRRKQIPDSEVDRLLGKDIRLPSFLAHTRGLRSHRRRAKAVEAENQPVLSSQLARSRSPPLEPPTPLLRLPGGFALVRQPPETPQSQTSSAHEASPQAEIARQGSSTGSAVSMPDTSQRRSSLYDQQWQVLVAPIVAINKRQRNSSGSCPSLHSRSSTSSPPTSSLAQELTLPRTPPPIPLQPTRVPGGPPTSPPQPFESEKRLERKLDAGEEDHDTHTHGMLDRARGARDAWKRHQKELKQEKLKQSIKVLGPTDPAVVAGYVKREGRRVGHGDTEAGRMPGYLVTGPV